MNKLRSFVREYWFLLIIVSGCSIHWALSTRELIEAETASALITGECWYVDTPSSTPLVICDAVEINSSTLARIDHF